MSTPNFEALQRISAAWHFLVTHPELPPFTTFAWVDVLGRVSICVRDRAEVDAYVAALGLTAPRLDRITDGVWQYEGSNSVWRVWCEVREPFPQHGVETAANSGPDRVTLVTSHG